MLKNNQNQGYIGNRVSLSNQCNDMQKLVRRSFEIRNKSKRHRVNNNSKYDINHAI